MMRHNSVGNSICLPSTEPICAVFNTLQRRFILATNYSFIIRIFSLSNQIF